jgi:hypothetical protein
MNQPEKGVARLVYWAPRVLCILAILFISMFALDAFSPDLSVWQQIGGFLMHMIPSFVLAILLFFAWRHEKWGGIIFLLIGLIFTPIIFNWNYRMNNSVWISLSVIALITIPFVVVGVLFIIHDLMRRKKIGSH